MDSTVDFIMDSLLLPSLDSLFPEVSYLDDEGGASLAPSEDTLGSTASASGRVSAGMAAGTSSSMEQGGIACPVDEDTVAAPHEPQTILTTFDSTPAIAYRGGDTLAGEAATARSLVNEDVVYVSSEYCAGLSEVDSTDATVEVRETALAGEGTGALGLGFPQYDNIQSCVNPPGCTPSHSGDAAAELLAVLDAFYAAQATKVSHQSPSDDTIASTGVVDAAADLLALLDAIDAAQPTKGNHQSPFHPDTNPSSSTNSGDVDATAVVTHASERQNSKADYGLAPSHEQRPQSSPLPDVAMYQGVVSSYNTPESTLSPEEASGAVDSYFPIPYQGAPFDRHPATQPRNNLGMPIHEDRRPGSAEVDTSGVHVQRGISQGPSNPVPVGYGNGFVQGPNNPSPAANAEYSPIDYSQTQPFAATKGWRKYAAKHRQESRAREYGTENHMGPLTDSQVLNHTPHSSHHHAAPIPYPPGLGYGSSMHNDHLSLLGYPAMPPHQGMSNPPMAMPRPMYPKAIPPSSSMNIRGGRTSVANPRRPLPTPHNPEPQHPVASTSATPSHPYPFNPQIPRDLPRYPPPPGPPPGYPFHNGQGGHTNVVNPRGLLQAPHNPEPQHPVASTSATPSYPHPVNPQIPRDLPRYSPPPGPPPGYPFHNGPVPELAPQPGGSNEGQDAALLVPVTLIKSKGTKRRHNETDEEKQFTEFIEFAQSLVRTWKAQFVRDMPCPLPGCNVVLTTDLSKEDWREHIKEHGLGQHTLIQCPLCLLDPDVTPPILQAMSLGEHLKLEMHYDSHRVKCPVCLRTESRIDSLKRHMRTPGCHADPNNQHRADKLKAMMRRPDALILRQDIVNLYS